MIKTMHTVLFDLDGTLLDRDNSVLSFAKNQYDRLKQQLGTISKDLYIKRFIELDDLGIKTIWRPTANNTKCKVADAVCKNLIDLPRLITSLD